MNIILRNKKYYKVLSALLNYPEKSDQELAAICDMERPTFNIIKNKLYKKKLIKHYYIPSFRDVGTELMVVFHIRLRVGNDINKYLSNIENLPHVIFLLKDSRYLIGIAVEKDYTSFERNLANVLYDKRYIDRDDVFIKLFSLYNSDVVFFDFKNWITRTDIPKLKKNRATDFDTFTKKIKVKDMKIMYALCKYAGATIEDMVKIVGFSRSTIRVAKTRLIDSGVMREANLAELENFDFVYLFSSLLEFVGDNVEGHIGDVLRSSIVSIIAFPGLYMLNIFNDMEEDLAEMQAFVDDTKLMSNNPLQNIGFTKKDIKILRNIDFSSPLSYIILTDREWFVRLRNVLYEYMGVDGIVLMNRYLLANPLPLNVEFSKIYDYIVYEAEQNGYKDIIENLKQDINNIKPLMEKDPLYIPPEGNKK